MVFKGGVGFKRAPRDRFKGGACFSVPPCFTGSRAGLGCRSTGLEDRSRLLVGGLEGRSRLSVYGMEGRSRLLIQGTGSRVGPKARGPRAGAKARGPVPRLKSPSWLSGARQARGGTTADIATN